MYREGARWAIKSAIGLAINLLLLTVWVDGLSVPAELAIIPNWILLSVYGYVVAGWWVFKNTKAVSGVGGHIKQWAGQQLIMGGGKVVNYIVYVALVQVPVDYRLAWIIGAGVGFAISFGGSREWWSQPAVQK